MELLFFFIILSRNSMIAIFFYANLSYATDIQTRKINSS